MKRQIVLEVTFRAIARSDEFIPESTAAEESVTIIIPNLDNKYVVFPKVLEGVTIGVIKNHQENVRGYLAKKADEERRKREFEQIKMRYPDGQFEESDIEGEMPFDDDELPSDDLDDTDEDDNSEIEESEDEGDSTIDFGRIAKEAEQQMRDDGFDVEVTHTPAAARGA